MRDWHGDMSEGSKRSEGPSYSDVERELREHPAVAACAVTRVETGPGQTRLLAYVVLADAGADAATAIDGDRLRVFLALRTPPDRLPDGIVQVGSLPRTADGEIDYDALPRPAWRGGRTAVGKGAHRSASPGVPMSMGGVGCAAVLAVPVAIAAFLITDLLWPHSTDLSGVPQPWAALFFGLYVAECLSFGLGIVFLLLGRPALGRSGSTRGLTTAAHLAITWLLVAWWPQDNFYRLAAKTDWPRQAALVYSFNITLMIAAAVVVLFVFSRLVALDAATARPDLAGSPDPTDPTDWSRPADPDGPGDPAGPVRTTEPG